MSDCTERQIVFQAHPYNRLPAVVIGGPPHSGKSVLAYALTRALRGREVAHYVIRAYPPDGEGDWLQESDPETVRHYRVKGARSEAWLPPLVRDIAGRHLPLVVDMGGLPTFEQEAVLDTCTHAVLLAPGAAARNVWAGRFARYGLVLLADLHSDLTGQPRLDATVPLIAGALTGLERHVTDSNLFDRQPAFAALVDRLSALFTAAGQGLKRTHLADAPVELVVDLAALAARLDVDPRAWPPGALPRVLDYLPAGTSLGLYGRGPNWLYAAVGAHVAPAPFWLFDVRRGWVRAPDLVPAEDSNDGERNPVAVTREEVPQGTLLTFTLRDAYLDLDATGLQVPAFTGETLILSGKLPLWLSSALVRAYRAARIAIVQPQLHGAVIVVDRTGGTPGDVVEVPGSMIV